MVKIVVKPVCSSKRDSQMLRFSRFFSLILAFLKMEWRNGNMLPNVARYQLRHTPKIFNFISTMVKPVVKPLFSLPLDHDFLAFPPFFARLLAFLKITAENDCTLPNVARYQLRHTPKISILRPKHYTTKCNKCQVETFMEILLG